MVKCTKRLECQVKSGKFLREIVGTWNREKGKGKVMGNPKNQLFPLLEN